jgi:hypothetical protein
MSHGVGSKLDAAAVVRIREARAAGVLSKDLALQFGVSQSLICQVATGRLWPTAPGPLTRINSDISLPAEVRFYQKVAKAGPGDCWPWTGGCTPDGYGVFHLDGEDVVASRYALSLKLGRPLLEAEKALHECDNPPCCNPDHLFEGTTADNNADCRAKGRNARVLTDDQIAAIRSEGVDAGWGARAAIARRFGISGQHVGRILRGVARASLASGASS